MANTYSGKIVYEIGGEFMELDVPFCPSIEALATYARALQTYTVAKLISVAWINSSVITQNGSNEAGFDSIDDKARIQIARQLPNKTTEYRQIVVVSPVASLFDANGSVKKAKGEALVTLQNTMTGRSYYFRSGKYSTAPDGIYS
jgi:hypothetical protein